MPTNLKSLLSRSRSRNELKLREKEDGGASNETSGSNSELGSANNSAGQCSCFQQLEPTESRRGAGAEPELMANRGASRTASCSALGGVGLVDSPYCSCRGGCEVCKNNSGSSSFSAASTLSIRKCETVLALSRISSSPPPGSSSHDPHLSSSMLSMGKMKSVKDKLLSTSSSTLNNLIHSSSNRSRFLNMRLPRNNHVVDVSSSSSSGSHPPLPPSSDKETQCSPTPPSLPSLSPITLVSSGFRTRSQLSIAEGSPSLVTPVNRLRRNFSATTTSNTMMNSSSPGKCETSHGAGGGEGCSRSSSFNSFSWKEDTTSDVFCRLCLSNSGIEDTAQLQACLCRYCKDCLVAYVSFEITEGAYEISCPDASCEKQGVLSLVEIEALVPVSLVEKHRKFRMYREVEKDGQVAWCPTAGCETVCPVQEVEKASGSRKRKAVMACDTCCKSFCADCKLAWHPDSSCESFRRKLVKQGKLIVDETEIYAIESIKKCPFCHVPIEKDLGCAQMMCKRCKHVFCWYCLTSLDDDFLLRHYDKGPCKNKLGHSRASVVWHRAQVIGIFAGFGVLVLLASPLLILAAPCLLCCRCRYCANKLDPEDPVQL